MKAETLKLADRVRDDWTMHLLKKGFKSTKSGLICMSGARCMTHTLALREKGIPAALKSAHLDGLGIDLRPVDEAMLPEFQAFCEKNVPIWAVRMEDKRATTQWVHLDLRGVGIFLPG